MTIVVPVSAPGPAHYQWQFNGSNLANNVLMPVAGSVNPGFAGDGGPALSAKLSVPAGIAFDNGGNMFIADAGNLIVADSLNSVWIETRFALAGVGFGGVKALRMSAIV